MGDSPSTDKEPKRQAKVDNFYCIRTSLATAKSRAWHTSLGGLSVWWYACAAWRMSDDEPAPRAKPSALLRKSPIEWPSRAFRRLGLFRSEVATLRAPCARQAGRAPRGAHERGPMAQIMTLAEQLPGGTAGAAAAAGARTLCIHPALPPPTAAPHAPQPPLRPPARSSWGTRDVPGVGPPAVAIADAKRAQRRRRRSNGVHLASEFGVQFARAPNRAAPWPPPPPCRTPRVARGGHAAAARAEVPRPAQPPRPTQKSDQLTAVFWRWPATPWQRPVPTLRSLTRSMVVVDA